MKRRNLLLDENLLEEAKRVLGLKTYSDMVTKALEEVVRVHKVKRIPEFFGKLKWHGNLAEMRGDQPRG